MISNGMSGSIFDISPAIAEGVTIFIPCGLTALRADYSAFRKSLYMEKECGGLKTFINPQTGQSIVAFENPQNVIPDENAARRVVESALAIMSASSLNRIAMNGIRLAGQNHDSRQELALVNWVTAWCNENSNTFESCTFVDLRGGFDFLRDANAQRLKTVENDEIIDHIEAIRGIVERKCARCGGAMSGSMGCLFDRRVKQWPHY